MGFLVAVRPERSDSGEKTGRGRLLSGPEQPSGESKSSDFPMPAFSCSGG